MQSVRLRRKVSIHEIGVVVVQEYHVVSAVEDKCLLGLPGLPHRRPEVVVERSESGGHAVVSTEVAKPLLQVVDHCAYRKQLVYILLIQFTNSCWKIICILPNNPLKNPATQ